MMNQEVTFDERLQLRGRGSIMWMESIGWSAQMRCLRGWRRMLVLASGAFRQHLRLDILQIG